MFLSRYNDRPSSLKLEHEVEINGRKGTIHALNEFDITVWADGEVTAQRRYYASSSPEKHFPNMSVSDGSINFPIEDLVSFILARISAEELAEGIMSDDEARSALVYKMSERYASPGFEDTDRREFLTKIQKQIYAVSIDRAIERLNKAETAERCRSDYYRWKAIEIGIYRNLYERYECALCDLREAGLLDADGERELKRGVYTPDALDAHIKENRDPVVSESVGPEWYASRDYWRAELAKHFPEPTVADEVEA